MDNFLFAASDDGVLGFEREGEDWRAVSRGLGGQRVTAIATLGAVVLAGTRSGIYRSDDLGQRWRLASEGLTAPHVRWLAFHADGSGLALAGTEPAGLFISHDGGETWDERPEVGELRDEYGWYLPYSPAAGCVRGFAAHGSRAYAAVEVGGLLRSDDRGQTWSLAAGSTGDPRSQPDTRTRSGVGTGGYLHPDVHSVLVHPSSVDLVYAPTGGGFYRSRDGGATWAESYRCYCRAAWVDPADAEHVVLGPADGVARNGRIEESVDGGRTWRPANSGLKVPWPQQMVERFLQVGYDLMAVLSNGELLVAPLATLMWQRILPEAGGIRAVASMRG